MTFNLIIAGVGGQGTVLASRLIAAAAMKKGYDVRTTETIGMAQRGGSVFGHCRIGENIFSPIIPLGCADALIAFEPAEAVRQLPYLRTGGTMIVCDSAVSPAGGSAAGQNTGAYQPDTLLNYLKANTARLVVIDGQRIMAHNAKTLNVAVLGAAAHSGIFPFDAETLKEIIPEILPQRFVDMNLKAFELGRQLIS